MESTKWIIEAVDKFINWNPQWADIVILFLVVAGLYILYLIIKYISDLIWPSVAYKVHKDHIWTNQSLLNNIATYLEQIKNHLNDGR